MAPKVNTEDLVSAAEVARILGLSHHNTVATDMRRYDDFPQPVVNLSGGRIRLWLRQDITVWKDARSSGR